jgi:hypothetical protein
LERGSGVDRAKVFLDAVTPPLRPVKPRTIAQRFAVQSVNGDAAERR